MLGLADGIAAGYGIGSDMRERKRRQEWEDEYRARQRAQWGREDAARGQLDQLGTDIRMGGQIQQEPGYVDATGGLETAAPSRRVPMSDADVESRLGDISLSTGDVRGYRESRTNKKGLQKEADAKAFGARMQQFLQGDDTAFANEIRQGNLDGNTRGTLGRMPDGNYAYTDPESGDVVPLSRAEVGTLLQQAWAFGQGDVALGFQAMSQQEAREHAKRQERKGDARYEREFGLRQRGTAVQEAQQKDMERYHRGMLGIQGTRAQADLTRAQADKQRQDTEKLGRMGQMIQMVGPDGQPRAVVPVLSPQGVSFQEVPIPPGFRMPKQMDPAQQRQLAMDLVGQPTGQLVNGKPAVYDPATAWKAAGEMLYGGSQGAPGGGPQLDADTAKIVEFLKSQAAPAAPPQRPQLTGPMNSQERMRGLYLGR